VVHHIRILEVTYMKWEKPTYNDLRFGFEVTMYIYNR
jgi:pyrroloquinoline quinone biosynthesis protein A